MKRYTVAGRPCVLIERGDKIGVSPRFPLLSRLLPLNSKTRKWLCTAAGCWLRLRFWWCGMIGRPIPMFEIASDPTIRLQDIKERRFRIIERDSK